MSTTPAALPVEGAPLRIADGLLRDGWAVCERFFDPQLSAELRRELTALRRYGSRHPVAVGHGRRNPVDRRVRGDWIAWFEPARLTPPQEGYMQVIDELHHPINAWLSVGLFDLECHYAVYPRGGAYQRHLDRHVDSGARPGWYPSSPI